MNKNLLTALKVVVPVAGLALTAATNYLNNKEFDEKVAKKVTEALANVTENVTEKN